MSFLYVSAAGDYDPGSLRRTITEALDRSGLPWSGRRVLVKPNLLGPFAPETAVCTHPAVIKVVREELVRRGSEVMVGDNPGVRGYGMFGRTAEVSGAAEASGEDLVNLTLHPHRLHINSRHVDSVSVSSEILDADILVSLPKFKTHMATVITGAIKNSFGFLVGAEKARMHALAPRPEDFGDLVVDVYAVRPPDLVIMDAVVGMDGNGPSGGRVKEIGHILSSDSGGAVDLAMCRMAGVDPARVATQKVAAARGLAPRSLEELDLEGEIPRLEHFRLPANLIRFDPGGLMQRFVQRRISAPQMRVDRDVCNACRICAESCPAGAINVENYPIFDYDKCIACYCCYELCPRNAITVGRMMRFIRR